MQVSVHTKIKYNYSGRKFFVFLFLFFVSHLLCKVNLSQRYSRHIDNRLVRTSGSEYVGPGSFPDRRVWIFFFFFSFFSFFFLK